MRVDVPSLRLAANTLFDHLDEIGVESVSLDGDFYWQIDEKELYDPTRKPTAFTLGQLSSDRDEIANIVAGKPVISYKFVWLASLLRAVGETIVR